MVTSFFKSPFLHKITFEPTNGAKEFPFNLPLFSRKQEVEFTQPITFFVGENGSGKSTLLEAIAMRCGFNIHGGNRNHVFGSAETKSLLPNAIKLSWLPKVSTGFFMRAESFFNFASYLDEIAKDDPSVLTAYGHKSLHAQSHGESFLSLFNNHFGRGIYILDEPEAALSPTRQLAFLSILKKLETHGESQFIIATHSPILLSYPGATVLSIEGRRIKEVDYQETDHFTLTKSFLENPESYFQRLFA